MARSIQEVAEVIVEFDQIVDDLFIAVALTAKGEVSDIIGALKIIVAAEERQRNIRHRIMFL